MAAGGLAKGALGSLSAIVGNLDIGEKLSPEKAAQISKSFEELGRNIGSAATQAAKLAGAFETIAKVAGYASGYTLYNELSKSKGAGATMHPMNPLTGRHFANEEEFSQVQKMLEKQRTVEASTVPTVEKQRTVEASTVPTGTATAALGGNVVNASTTVNQQITVPAGGEGVDPRAIGEATKHGAAAGQREALATQHGYGG